MKLKAINRLMLIIVVSALSVILLSAIALAQNDDFDLTRIDKFFRISRSAKVSQVQQWQSVFLSFFHY
jgi:hypothetical protein